MATERGSSEALLGPQGRVGVWLSWLGSEEPAGASRREATDRELLGEWEIAAGERLRDPLARTRYLASHAELRRLLARMLGCHPADVPLLRRPGGQLVLSGRRAIHLSLARCGAQLALAASGGEGIGVDVESLRPDQRWLALAQRVLSPHEQDALAELEPGSRARRIAATWVVKEAAVKALGEGFALDPAEIEVRWDSRGRPSALRWDRLASVSCRLVPCVGGHVCAVALRGPWPGLTLAGRDVA